MRKHIVAGNWKMNKNLQEGIALATEINDLLKAEKPNCEVIIGTPFIHLAKVSEVVDHSLVAVSAENCADKASGAYTGEVSAEMGEIYRRRIRDPRSQRTSRILQ